MSAIIGLLSSLLVFAFIGFCIHLVGLLLRKLGLGFITNFLDRMIFHDPDTIGTSIWHAPWLRYGLLLITILVTSSILSSIVGTVMGLKGTNFTGLIKWASIIVVALYIGWVFKRGKPDSNNNQVKLSSTRQNNGTFAGFSFKTNKGILRLSNPFRGIFISGGAGSGKSKSLIEPIIQQSGSNNFTGVLYDFKFPTLANEVHGSYTESNVSLHYVNFTDLNRSCRLNPINPTIITSSNYAREAATTVISNLDFKAAQKRDYWIQSAEALLTGAIWFLRETHPQYCTLPHAVSLILESEPKTLIQTLKQNEEVGGIIASIASSSESQNQMAGVFATVQNYLAVINNPDVFWVMSGDEVDFDLNIKTKPGFLVIGNHPTLGQTVSPLISLIISTAIKRMNQSGRANSVVILDEAPTLFIPNFQNIPATARSNKMATVYAAQDISQMEGLIGPFESEMIISNLGNQFFMRTTSDKTAKRVSAMFGKHDVEYTSKSKGKSSKGIFDSTTKNVGTSTSIQQRERLEAQDVMRFSPGQCAAIIAEGNTNEFIGIFIEQASRSKEIHPFKQVDEQDKRTNFKRIKEEVRNILFKSEELPKVKEAKPKTISTQEPNWEDFT